MNSVADNLFNRRRIRTLIIVDNLSREVRYPERIQVDNGVELISKDLDKWAYKNGVTFAFSRPEKLADKALLELFNGSSVMSTSIPTVFNQLTTPRKKLKLGTEITTAFAHNHRSATWPRSSSGSSISGSQKSLILHIRDLGEAQIHKFLV